MGHYDIEPVPDRAEIISAVFPVEETHAKRVVLTPSPQVKVVMFTDAGTDLDDVGYCLDGGPIPRATVKDQYCFANDIDKKLAGFLAFDCATVVDGASGVIRGIKYKIQPSAGGRQRHKLDDHGTKHNSCLYASEVAPYVAVVRSDDGNITVFAPEASAKPIAGCSTSTAQCVRDAATASALISACSRGLRWTQALGVAAELAGAPHRGRDLQAAPG